MTSTLEPAASADDAVTNKPGDAAEREFTVEALTQRKLVFRRFIRHRLAMISLMVLTAVMLFAFVGLRLWDQDFAAPGIVENRGRPTLDLIPWIDGDGFQIGNHPFGQDDIGRDYYAVTLRGAQQSLLIAFVAGLVATAIGVIVGGLSGFYRGWVDNVLMRFVDVMFTVPVLVVAAVLSRTWDGGGIFVTAMIIALVSWLGLSRIIRGEFMSLREKEFVESARAIGASNSRIMWKHLLPNVVGSIVVSATLAISIAILTETALSFLGLGVRGSDWSLGKQVSQYQSAFNTRPWLFWWPGLFIITIALCVNFIGDGLRDAFDPRQTRERR